MYSESAGSGKDKFGKKWFRFDWKAMSKAGQEWISSNSQEFTKTTKTGFGHQLGKMATNPTNLAKAGLAIAATAGMTVAHAQSQSDYDKNHKEMMRQLDHLRSGQEELLKSHETMKKNLGDFKSNIESLTKENERLKQQNEELKQQARQFLKNNKIITPKPKNEPC